MTCSSHTIIGMPTFSFSCEAGAGAHLSVGVLRVCCDRMLFFYFMSQALHLLLFHQFMPQMRVYVQGILPRSRCFDLITRLSKCPKDTSQCNSSNQSVLIIFLLVHSTRHVLGSQHTTWCHSKQDFEVSELD